MHASDPESVRWTFTTTHWSVVLRAGGTDLLRATQALEQLCQTYWYPLYAFIRRKGHGPHDAQDLTQAFFARLLEKNYVAQADPERGRFRTYLLAALTHFLADEWDKTRRLKRGGGQIAISFDAVSAEERYRLEPVDQRDAAKLTNDAGSRRCSTRCWGGWNRSSAIRAKANCSTA